MQEKRKDGAEISLATNWKRRQSQTLHCFPLGVPRGEWENEAVCGRKGSCSSFDETSGIWLCGVDG